MSDTTKNRWFIDAWAVLDGYAFASLRPPKSIDAEVIFFVAPPYFEPEPVASLATALAATRGHFQEGFRDAEGAEIGFATLDQVIEAIRRGYRAGGLDLDGGGLAVPLPAEPLEPAGGAGFIHPSQLVDDEMKKIWAELRGELTATATGVEHENRLQHWLARLLERAMHQLVPKFVGYAAAAMLVRLAGRTEDRSAAIREVCAWIDKARALGVDVHVSSQNPPSVIANVVGSPTGFGWPTPQLASLPDEVVHFLNVPLHRSGDSHISDGDLLFNVPIAEVFQAGTAARRYPPVPTLWHLMAAATADRRYVHALESAHQIVPLLVLALLQVPDVALPHPAFPPRSGTSEGRDLASRATSWLARALPSASLSGHPAEEALHGLTFHLLRGDRDDEGDDGSPARPIAPNRPPDRGGSSRPDYAVVVSRTGVRPVPARPMTPVRLG